MNNDNDQLDLLSEQPIARNTDANTSHRAAAEITASGKRATQQHVMLRGVQAHPGKTSAELAVICGVDRYVAARRLPELRDAELVSNGESRRCSRTGKAAMTWVAVDG